MREQQIRRLPVLSRQRNLVGLVSRRDIALGTGDATLAAASIQKVCMPESPKPLPGQKRE
jgi:CBS-domain-containing membrane protein